MVKTIVIAAIVLSLLSFLGCSELSDIPDLMPKSSPGSPDTVERSKLGEEWQMDQMVVHLDAEGESLVLLRLPDGGEVDGYFFLEEGEDIDFRISGDSLIYELNGPDVKASERMTSTRFSFTAEQKQVTTYTFTFNNPTKNEETVFLEVIYPVNGALFFPLTTQ